ncbi:MAG: hypothetical protein ACJAVI_000713 [Candidatus Azotimanducaceae bacterium]|jgi:hypothetical protein
MIQRNRFCTLFALSLLLGLTHNANATVVQVGDLNIIDQAGNASDGLRYLDYTFSSGFSLAGAVANAQLSYANARLATQSEWDDLYEASGIDYLTIGLSASDAFEVGPGFQLTTGAFYEDDVLYVKLGSPGAEIFFWTDPDGSAADSSTRDYVGMHPNLGTYVYQSSLVSPSPSIGWLLVSEAAVPAPPALVLFVLGLAGLGLAKRRIGQAQA